MSITIENLRKRYLKIYTASISDVLKNKGFRFQCLPSGITSVRPEARIAGPVVTMKTVPTPNKEDRFHEKVATMANACSEGCIIVIDTTRDYTQNIAHFGDIMGLLAQINGCTGVVVDGGVRDLEIILQMGLGVFSRYRTPKGSLMASKIIEQNTPIKIGDVLINPGDFIVGDMDGLVVIPKEMIEEVLVKAEDVISNENKIREAIKSGMSLEEVTKKYGGF